MKRYVNVTRSAAGVTVVTVSLVDGELSSKWSAKSYVGDVDKATVTADSYARKNLDALRQGVEKIEEGGDD